MRVGIGLAIAVGLAALSGPALAEDASGKWTGKISAGGQELPVVLVIVKASGSAFAGHLESPTQTDQSIPIEAITSDGKSLSFTSVAVMGSYEAKWDDAKKAWLGKWSQNGADLDLALSRAK